MIAPLKTRARPLLSSFCALACTLVAGCQLTPTPIGASELEGLTEELAQLETLVSATRDDLAELTTTQSERMDAVNNRLRTIDDDVKQLPGVVQSACQAETTLPTTCDEVAEQTILIADDKMVLGELEHLWITPPDINLQARIDTGTSTNALHATEVRPFERDGDDWVRFTLTTPGDNTAVVVERKIVRLLRNSKRPVVRLRVQLGNVLDSFDFILTDRSNSEHQVLLGRTFLQDIALVDVGRAFVQPEVKSRAKSKELAGDRQGQTGQQ